VTYNPDLPTLEGEEIDDGFEELEREEASAQLAAIDPLYRLTLEPDWEALDRYLSLEEGKAIEEMLKTRDAAATLEWRARVTLVRELRALPETTALRVKGLTGALEEADE